MTFKVGDRIKMKKDCGSSLRKGDAIIVKADSGGRLYVENEKGYICTCQNLWLPLTDVISKESLVAGETVIVRDKYQRLVLEVGETSFLVSSWSDHELTDSWIKFTKAVDLGWKIKLSPEQETPETITHEGKKYDKKAFEERLKELKPIE